MDKSGNLWLGTNREGLIKFDGNSFRRFSEADGLCSNTINALLEDDAGHLWMGTPVGLCKFDGEEFSHLPLPFQDTSSIWLDEVYPVINPNEVHALYQDKKGDLWIGTGGSGVFLYDGKHFKQFLADRGMKYSDSLHHNWVTSITADARDHIWITSMSYGGATRFDGNNFHQFTVEEGLCDPMARIAYPDRDGNMWIGFNGNRNSGLNKFDGTSFTTYSKEDGLCNANTRGILEDSKGNLWLGSGRGGICIFDGKTFSPFTDKNGNLFDAILFLLEDSDGNVWFGGSYGKLFRYDGETLMDFSGS